jgi:hypothetical protein
MTDLLRSAKNILGGVFLVSRPQRSAAPLPGDFATHPCPEYFSFDLATTFILQEAR